VGIEAGERTLTGTSICARGRLTPHLDKFYSLTNGRPIVYLSFLVFLFFSRHLIAPLAPRRWKKEEGLILALDPAI
jgi:hypothetical protein